VVPAEHDGKEVAIIWHMRKTNADNTGVTGRLFLTPEGDDTEEIDSATILGIDTTGVKRTIVRTLATGDTIDLALTPGGVTGNDLCSDVLDPSDGSDGSFTVLRISEELPPGPPPTVIASSVEDWSVTGTQRERGWQYGYYDQRDDVTNGDGVYGPDDFIEFLNDDSGLISADPALGAWRDSPNHWNGASWDLEDNNITGHGPWTSITCSAGHPAGNGQTDSEVHWAIRRWVSDHDGDVEISGIMSNTAAAGDGTVCRIFHNDTEILARVTNGDVVHYSVQATVADGDTLDFAIDADGAGNLAAAGIDAIVDGSDNTNFTATIATREPVTAGPFFVRGDADASGAINITDAIFLLGYLFQGTAAPTCIDAADVDGLGDGAPNITDAIYLLGWLFQGSAPPPAPVPMNLGQPSASYVAGQSCGVDPGDGDPADPADGMGCASFPPCN
jgi:hypothetical protein